MPRLPRQLMNRILAFGMEDGTMPQQHAGPTVVQTQPRRKPPRDLPGLQAHPVRARRFPL